MRLAHLNPEDCFLRLLVGFKVPTAPPGRAPASVLWLLTLGLAAGLALASLAGRLRRRDPGHPIADW